MSQHELDCRGLRCPMPIVKMARVMKELKTGETLKVLASDPAFQVDLEAWLRKMGQGLQSFEDQAGTQTAVVIKQV